MKHINTIIEGMFDVDNNLDNIADELIWGKWLENAGIVNPLFSINRDKNGLNLYIDIYRKGNLVINPKQNPSPEKIHRLNMSGGVFGRRIMFDGDIDKKDIEIIEFDDFSTQPGFIFTGGYLRNVKGVKFISYKGLSLNFLKLNNVQIELVGSEQKNLILACCNYKNVTIKGENVGEVYINPLTNSQVYKKVKSGEVGDFNGVMELLKQEGCKIDIKNLKRFKVNIDDYDYRFSRNEK